MHHFPPLPVSESHSGDVHTTPFPVSELHSGDVHTPPLPVSELHSGDVHSPLSMFTRLHSSDVHTSPSMDSLSVDPNRERTLFDKTSEKIGGQSDGTEERPPPMTEEDEFLVDDSGPVDPVPQDPEPDTEIAESDTKMASQPPANAETEPLAAEAQTTVQFTKKWVEKRSEELAERHVMEEMKKRVTDPDHLKKLALWRGFSEENKELAHRLCRRSPGSEIALRVAHLEAASQVTTEAQKTRKQKQGNTKPTAAEAKLKILQEYIRGIDCFHAYELQKKHDEDAAKQSAELAAEKMVENKAPKVPPPKVSSI